MPLVGRRVYVPDHKVYFADFDDADAAYYLCGMLNSTIVREYVQSHTIQIQVSNIFKHLRLPEFNPSNTEHMKISELCRKAHAATSAAERSKKIGKTTKAAEALLAS